MLRGSMASKTAKSEHHLESEQLACRLATEGGAVWLIGLTDLQTGQSLLTEAALFCSIEADSAGGQATCVESPAVGELLISWPGVAAELQVRLDGACLRWRVNAAGHVYFPFLAALRVSHHSQEPEADWMGESSFRDGQGRPIFRNADWPLPIVKISPNGRSLTLLAGRGVHPASFAPGLVWSAPGLTLEPETVRGLEMELILHDGGWPAAFELFRARVRASFNLAQYQRPDFAWYNDQIVQHFTFLYGREILNLEIGQFELERFLDEGERDFGGYDGFLIWGVYPRIGVDERTQWGFYDDFPGGRESLRAMAQRARERGVRFFIPYKPWDRSADLYGRPAGSDPELLAQLVADVEADGIFLDTMSAIGGEFREAIDQARPGVVFCSEGRAKGKAFEIITGCWDQSSNRDFQQGNWCAVEETMPGVDLYRFIFPEHRLFVISRHAMGADRIRIIQRGFFSGMGWVVWQDIFGLVLPYSPGEAALLKKCRTIFREHRQALWNSQPTPLTKTLAPGVYANQFPGETKRLWTFYNETEHRVNGPVLHIQPRPGCHCVNVWANQEAEVDAAGCMRLALGPRSVGAVVELPRLLTYTPDDQQVALVRHVPGAILQICQAGGERSEPVGDRRFVDLRRWWQNRTESGWVRLLADGELLDQIVVWPQATGEK